MRVSRSVAVALAFAAGGWLTATATAQIRIQAHVVSGADAAMRGFRESDFPRVHRLAENLYAVEDIAGPIDGNTAFTTNAMFIITSEGVVVLDAFKNVASTTKLVDIIRGTPIDAVDYSINIGRFQYWYRAANNLHTMMVRTYAELDGTASPYVVTKRTPAVDMSGAALPTPAVRTP